MRACASRPSSARRSTTATDIVRSLRITGEAATDWRVAVEDPEIDLVVIGTRHDSHAEIAAAALRAGRAVFVEKPLGLTREEIDDVWDAGRDNDRPRDRLQPPLRPARPAPARRLEQADGPLHVVYRVNAPLAADHWLNDPRVGGGRILGEACHMFDFANWLCGTPLRVMAAALPAPPTVGSVESATITVEYADGSVATVLYSGARRRRDAQGARRGPARRALVGARRLPRADRLGRRRRADRGRARRTRATPSSCAGCSRPAAGGRASSRASRPPTRRRASRSPRSTRSLRATRWPVPPPIDGPRLAP